MRIRTPALLFAFAVVASASIATIVDAEWLHPIPPEQKFADIGARLLKQPLKPAPFALTDHLGKAFTPDQLSGAWTVVFFGYTHCADVCPTTLSTLARVDDYFARSNIIERPRFVFVSVDPKRDSIEVLREHVAFFSTTLVGATGSQRDLQALARSLETYYGYRDRETRAVLDVDKRPDAGEYMVEHSSDLHVFAPNGMHVGLIFPPFDAERVADAIVQFMAAAQNGIIASR